ncbi:MAG TPA: NAD(P)/FAD-dependent oxidoreductase [Solirubrobacterales bacterium]|nr:NAD(P)/FAD-dependent oxidoreductase [Solirubrobacterales bacterium]
MSKKLSIAVVGGGFGGVGAAVMLKREGYEDVTVFEKGERVGGVWQHNTYPGAACDIPSHLYEYSFAPNRWSRRYAPQVEIQAYVEGVARHFGVLDRIRTATEVRSAAWQEERGKWLLETSAGPHEADLLLTACGQLSVPAVPPIQGLESFDGPAFHTAEWRHDVDLSGKRVAVVGTGCSAIQVVPAIQPQVAQLDVYQRSPGWTLPKMDFEYSARAQALFSRPLLRRLDRASVFAFQEFAAAALTQKRWLLPALRVVGRRQINAAISDPELRRKVTPSDEFGCKRIMLTDEWYPTLIEPNVELVAERIEAVTAAGIRDATGVERATDAIILATGFASHDFVAPMEISGRQGRKLEEEWGEIARAYLGLSVPGFPNMFLLYGPNTNGGSGSVVNTLECGIGHVLAALREMESARARRIEVKPQAAEDFDRELRAALAKTVWHSGCSNWYVDENGNDPSNWPWIWSAYRRRTHELAPGAYELSRSETSPVATALG